MPKALIIGSSGGIGKALTQQLLKNDYQLTTISRHDGTLNGSIHLTADYEDEASLEKAAEKIDGDLDLVVFATGFLHSEVQAPEKSYKEVQTNFFQKSFLINAIGPIMLAKHLLKKIPRNQECKIAFLSARVGSISDNRLGGWYAYRASKAALNMLVKTLSIEVKRTHAKITIVALHPGTVDTGLSRPFHRNVPEYQLFTPKHSATKLLEVIETRTVAHTGLFFDWAGEEINP
jgi:NAD(P)-dependent dehydrogenase (short-subunit alcohol dehydrogenase family)